MEPYDSTFSGLVEMEELMGSYESQSIRIFWDYESSTIWKKFTPRGSVINNIKKALLNANMKGPVLLEVIGQTDSFPTGFEMELTDAAAKVTDFMVEIKEVKPRFVEVKKENGKTELVRQKEVADETLINSAVSLIRSSIIPPFVNVVIITGDGDFSPLVAEFKRRNYNVIVVLTLQAVNQGALAPNADVIWSFNDFITGLEPLYKKRTFEEKSQNVKLVGSVSRIMSIMQTLRDERIAATVHNLALVFGQIGLKLALDYGVQLGKFVLDEGGYAVYRFPNTQSWMSNDVSETAGFKNFDSKVWTKIGHDLLNNTTLQEVLKQSTNMYDAASKLRTTCMVIQKYYLSDVISIIRIMNEELKWIVISNCNDCWEIIGFMFDCIKSSYMTFSTNKIYHPRRTIPKPPVVEKPEDTKVIYVCWDYDSSPMPVSFEVPYALPTKMTSAVRNCNMKGPLTINVFAKKKVFAKEKMPSSVKKVFAQTNIVVTKIKFKKGRPFAVSPKISLDVGLFSADHLPPANYIFITGDSFYSGVMNNLKSYGHKIFLVQSENTVPQLTEIADVVWSFSDFFRGLPPFYEKDKFVESHDSSKIDEIAVLLKVLRSLRYKKILPTHVNILRNFPRNLQLKLPDILKCAIQFEAVVEEIHACGLVYRFSNEHLWFSIYDL